MMKTIGFLGCGNMGGAIARAVCKATEPENVFLANRTAAKAEALAAELGCQTATNAEVAGNCDLIFLAVKPQMMEAMLEPLRFILAERTERFGGRDAKAPIEGAGVSFPDAAFRLKNSRLEQLGKDFLIESEVEYPCLPESWKKSEQ